VLASLAALRGDPSSPTYPLFPTVRLAVPPTDREASSPPPCAEAEVGLDVRALPTSTSSAGIDRFVAAQVSQFEGHAPPGPPIRFVYWPGTGLFQATFDAPNPTVALARCRATVTRYLASAPRLPVVRQPAAHVVSACKPCGP
jgi:hypothetical protein